MELESFTVWTFNDDGKVSLVETFTVDEEDEARRALRAP